MRSRSVRALLVFLVALMATLPASPAAAKTKRVKVKVSILWGLISFTWERETGFDNSGPGSLITGRCEFTTQPTLDGRLQVDYSGYVVANVGTSNPEVSGISCAVRSRTQGIAGEPPTLTDSFEIACPGGMCAGSGGPVLWPLRPVDVCVGAFVIYGPVPVERQDIPWDCATEEGIALTED